MNNVAEIVLLASAGVIPAVGVVTSVISALGPRRAAAVGESRLEPVREQHERARPERLDTRPAAEH